MTDAAFIRRRITQLRMQKNISEYRMSLDLGHSRSYVQNIVSGRMLPSMEEFLYICEYFGITPKDFFEEAEDSPAAVRTIMENLKGMSEDDLGLISAMAERLKKKDTGKQ